VAEKGREGVGTRESGGSHFPLRPAVRLLPSLRYLSVTVSGAGSFGDSLMEGLAFVDSWLLASISSCRVVGDGFKVVTK
jgi:hypothetical protein